ncbi:hypothetical protein U9M48_034733 [Paspalum notatum var. saurae]|uniref:NB-ARC domain-containing protein n=1 Tax=Paspalum notatum var. saurae TaxID=547442 RepID=A0AAQ3UAJ5_PASNO
MLDRVSDALGRIHGIFEGGAPGSKILLTTRNRKVGEVVGSRNQLDLPFLSQDDSWQLFQQSLRLEKKIVEKCGGVPLAIKALASALHGKERIEEWKSMRDSNLLAVEGKEHSVSACLMLSYFYLPFHLKECFTLCSLFPKGHWIDKEALIDQWIAHDMITADDGVDYLGVQWPQVLQLSCSNDVVEYVGRVRCKMHDLVHDLARSILDRQISLVPKEETSSTKSYRYFSLTEQPEKPVPKNCYKNTRAIYAHEGNDIIFEKAMKKARHLRSITVESIYSAMVPSTIFLATNLKYIHMSRLHCEALPESISDVWGLQALYVTNSRLVKFPESISKLQKLRTLNLSYCALVSNIPDAIGNCHMISSIDLSHCSSLEVLPNFTRRNRKLRVLRLGYTRLERLPSSITTLVNLECLDLQWCFNLVELHEGIGGLMKLQVLNLENCGRVRTMPVSIGQLSGLRSLDLFVVGEGEEYAGISKLGNMNRITGNLTIRGIDCVRDPSEAQQACLQQKTNLQRLMLVWNIFDVVRTGMEEAVLDGLEPPSAIQELYMLAHDGISVQYGRGVDGDRRGHR